MLSQYTPPWALHRRPSLLLIMALSWVFPANELSEDMQIVPAFVARSEGRRTDVMKGWNTCIHITYAQETYTVHLFISPVNRPVGFALDWSFSRLGVELKRGTLYIYIIIILCKQNARPPELTIATNPACVFPRRSCRPSTVYIHNRQGRGSSLQERTFAVSSQRNNR